MATFLPATDPLCVYALVLFLPCLPCLRLLPVACLRGRRGLWLFSVSYKRNLRPCTYQLAVCQ
jgi:hypothetical protein